MMLKGRGHTQLSAGKPEIDNSVSCQRLLIIIPVHCSADHLDGDDDDVNDDDVDGGVDVLSDQKFPSKLSAVTSSAFPPLFSSQSLL